MVIILVRSYSLLQVFKRFILFCTSMLLDPTHCCIWSSNFPSPDVRTFSQNGDTLNPDCSSFSIRQLHLSNVCMNSLQLAYLSDNISQGLMPDILSPIAWVRQWSSTFPAMFYLQVQNRQDSAGMDKLLPLLLQLQDTPQHGSHQNIQPVLDLTNRRLLEKASHLCADISSSRMSDVCAQQKNRRYPATRCGILCKNLSLRGLFCLLMYLVTFRRTTIFPPRIA